MRFLILVVVTCALIGCADESSRLTKSEIEAIEGFFSSAKQSPEMMEKWARSCALCHVNGEGGAPVMGDAESWKPRLAKGNAVLYTNTLEGFNRMPPLGYCMDCTGEDYAAMINLLAGRAK